MNIEFSEINGVFVCDKWPENLSEVVGRTVICPCKSIYEQVTDRLVSGMVIRVFGEGKNQSIEFSTGNTCGTCTAKQSDLFLVPK